MSTDVSPLTEKQIALDALREMPESVTLLDIIEDLAILDAIRRGQEAADAGRVFTHEEVVRRSAEWISK